MRDIFVPLLLVVAAIGGVAWWSLHSDVMRAEQSASASVPAPAVETKPVQIHPRPKHNTGAQVAEATKPRLIPQPEPVVAGFQPASVRAIPPFPTTEQVKSGAQEENIVERYGDPSLSVTTSDHDHVFETLVYTGDDGQHQTLIHLEDGRVIAAYAQTMPPPMNMPVSNGRIRH